MRRGPRALAPFVLAVAGIVVPVLVFAGPPLLCHPYEIGSARSLPWDGHTWFAGRPDYDIRRLVGDIDSILVPSTPVIVRMETLRRAAIYASANQAVAGDLLARLGARTHAQTGDGLALAYLDLAYAVGALKEIVALDGSRTALAGRAEYLAPLVARLDAYGFVTKSLQLRPGDGSLEFAAALIAADNNRAAYEQHAARARAAASHDPLLARNIARVSN